MLLTMLLLCCYYCRWRCDAVTAGGEAEVIAATSVGRGSAL
jgi:hypothetical protein